MSKQAMIDLMTRLAQDRKESQSFKENPDRAMAGLDLSEEEKEMLKRAQREEIQGYLGQEIPYAFVVYGSVWSGPPNEE